MFYSLQLSNSKECWVVTRRYSEFLRLGICNLQLSGCGMSWHLCVALDCLQLSELFRSDAT